MRPLRLSALPTLLIAATLAASPALAQETTSPAGPPPAPEAELGGDRITAGVGIGSVPEYEGADANRIIPAAAAIGSISGFAFSTRGTRLFVDVIPNDPGPVLDIQAGPVIGLNFNRTQRRYDDDRIEALRRPGTAFEAGGYVGIGKTGIITSDYDSLSASVAYVADVGSVHKSYTITPQVNYSTPLSRKAFVAIAASAAYAGEGYANTYFSVDAADSIRSTLPQFDADAGWKNWSASAVVNYSLTGDLLGGLSVVGGVSYSKLLNDFADTPIVSIAGDRDQWFGAVGLAYTF